MSAVDQARQAPVPLRLTFTAERVRCACGVESAVFAPAPWYVGQHAVEVAEDCPACGKPLGKVRVPQGAEHELWVLAALPASRARAVSSELFDEVSAGRAPIPEPERGLAPSAWCRPHDAPDAYKVWLGKQPVAPGPVPWLTPVDLACTAALVVVVIGCALV